MFLFTTAELCLWSLSHFLTFSLSFSLFVCENAEFLHRFFHVVTMMTVDSSLPMVAVLASSLLKVHSKYPLVILVTEEVSPSSRDVLVSLNCILKSISLLSLPPSVQPAQFRWNAAFSKLLIWKLTEYNRVVWMDGDTMVLSDLDHLFEMEGSLIASTDLHSCHVSADKMCSSLLVVEPRDDVYASLHRFLFESGFTFANGDQEMIEEYFAMKAEVTRLDEKWSSFVYRCTCDDFPSVKNVSHQDRPMPHRHNHAFTPRFVHFTYYFLPIGSKGTFAENSECILPYYRQWFQIHRTLCASRGMKSYLKNSSVLCPPDSGIASHLSHLFPSVNPRMIMDYSRSHPMRSDG